MRGVFLLSLLVVIVCIACNSKKENKLTNTTALPSQVVTIDPKNDTTLRTAHGAIIKIPRDALQANGQSTVQLEIKEAYNITEMIMAGLATQSDGEPLSSGGMIYINAVGENTVRITKPISVALPTPFLDDKMQLYKGEVTGDGTINWKNPKPLPVNPQLNALNAGKKLFMTHCASCHGIEKDITGPSLAHVVKRNKWMLKDPGSEALAGLFNDDLSRRDTSSVDTLRHLPHNLLYAFTKNSQQVLNYGPSYFSCLHKRYNNAPMNPFPDLTQKDLDNLYAYIENESESRNLPIPDNGILKCADSCSLYQKLKDSLEELKARLEVGSTNMTSVLPGRSSSPVINNPGPASNQTLATPPKTDEVDPISNKSLYYQFTIESFGWYNIDMLLKIKDGNTESTLAVRIVGTYRTKMDVYLVIPSVKVILPGGKLDGKEDTYGFYKKDGSIPLPQNEKAYIITMGEQEDHIIFAKKEFITTRNQQFDMALEQVTKEVFNQQIKSLSIGELDIKVDETKNAQELRNTILKLKKAEELKPKNCDCDCFLYPMK